jgi:hypothetical protein
MKTRHPISLILVSLLLLLLRPSIGLSAQKLTQDELTFFEGKICPPLAAHCLECHSAEIGKIKGGLNLDSKHDWIKGGESGAIIALGDVKGNL